MLARFRLVEQLLNRNPQVGFTEINHEGMAVLLDYYNTQRWKKSQVFIAAGSEDLRALLPKLSLSENDSEAFIIVRPFIHSMLLYLRNDDGLITVFLFDSQNWGMRFHPTRLIVRAITNTFSQAKVFLSGSEVQPQYIQTGCNEYSFAFLNYLTQSGKAYCARMRESKYLQVNDFDRTYQLPNNAIPEEIRNLDEREYKQKLLSNLELVLALDTAVMTTVAKMSGLNLPCEQEATVFDNQMTVSINAASITIQYDADMIYSNCLLYSGDVIYPSGMQSANLDCISTLIPGTQWKFDKQTNQLTISAASVPELLAALHDLQAHTQAAYDKHMRQQLGMRAALSAMHREVKLAYECEKVKKNNRGGLDVMHAQAILAHYFRDQKDKIYVPPYNELLADGAVIDIVSLRERGIQKIVYCAQHEHAIQHSVAVIIELTQTIFTAAVINSYPILQLPNEFIIQQQKLFNAEVAFKMKPSAFAEQIDDWSCVVHVVSNIRLMCEDTVELNSNALPVDTLLKTYLRIYFKTSAAAFLALESAEAQKIYNLKLCDTFAERKDIATEKLRIFFTKNISPC